MKDVQRLIDRLNKAATWNGDWKHEAADALAAQAAEIERLTRERGEARTEAAAAEAREARLRAWLAEALDELDQYYQHEYRGDHPYTQRKLARARSAWADAHAALDGQP